jgi:hypothetical protein
MVLRNVGILAAVLLLGIALGAGGWLLGNHPCHAADATAAVGAVATDWTTTFEPDPFDRAQVRRSTVNVSRVAIVWSDGRTEMRSINK